MSPFEVQVPSSEITFAKTNKSMKQNTAPAQSREKGMRESRQVEMGERKRTK
jgi:hypothetical protein